jgi:ABC-type multidrug transport system fused ATPase/permease subunit
MKFSTKEILKLFNTIEKRQIFFLLFLILIGTILELLSLGIVLPAVKVFTDSEFLNQVYVFTGVTELSSDLLIFFVLSSVVGIFAIKNFFLWFVLIFKSKFLAIYTGNLQVKVFRGYLSQGMDYLNGKNSSTIIHNVSNLSGFFCSVYLDAIITIIIELVILIGVLSMLLYYNFQITLVIIIVFGGCVLLIYFYNKKKLKHIGRSRNFYSEKQLENLQRGIGGIREIKIIGKESFFINNFKNSTDQLASANYQSSIISGSPRLLIEFLAVLCFSIAIIILTTQGNTLVESLPLLAVYSAATYKLLPSFQKVLFLMNRLKYSYPTAKQLLNLLPELLVNKEIKYNKDSKLTFSNEINVKNLSFKYPKTEKLILSNINIKIPKNSFVGISGESGAGKSTLIDLILGLLEPTTGSVFVDNIDISKNLRSWQNTIGYVPQDIFLISSSVKNNIALGLDSSEINDKLLNQAIDRSCLRKFIEALPDKENTIIGEHGSLISWGQRQRIGIARSLYNNPSVLIFDEATSSLDPETEGEILREIKLLKKNLTLIFISHKKNSLKNCDKLFSIKNGIIL